MFEPAYINGDHVEVIWCDVYSQNPETRSVILKAILKLEDRGGASHHVVLLKPNRTKTVDQVVADRFKVMCNLIPTHAVCVKLRLRQHDALNEFIMMSSNLEFDEFETLAEIDELRDQTEIVEMLKIMMFRFLLGTYNTSPEHVLRTPRGLMSIAETYIGNCEQGTSLCDKFSQFVRDHDHAEICGFATSARDSLLENFDFDNMRGILLQTQQPEREIRGMKPKFKLAMPVKRTAELIEERLDILRTSSIDEILQNICM